MKNITFKTIPARASHMGGIWERAVGSVKYHLKRVLKDTKLNIRQFDYVLKQIEACLNSRPLWTITNEADDIEVLTPSHFFNFQAINTLPRPDVSHIPLNRLNQYQYLYRLYCDFWRAWSKEYLHQFQVRPKWQKEHPNAIIGQIVLVSEDNLPPSRWALGKIIALHPGKDGLIRSVEVLSGKTTLRRPIHKLALLPTPDNDEIELLEKAQGGENVVANKWMSTNWKWHFASFHFFLFYRWQHWNVNGHMLFGSMSIVLSHSRCQTVSIVNCVCRPKSKQSDWSE